jgi:hypothetical protein
VALSLEGKTFGVNGFNSSKRFPLASTSHSLIQVNSILFQETLKSLNLQLRLALQSVFLSVSPNLEPNATNSHFTVSVRQIVYDRYVLRLASTFDVF